MMSLFKPAERAAESCVLARFVMVCSVLASAVPATAYGQMAALQAVALDASHKLRPSDPIPPGAAGLIALEGARNEFEMGQVALRSSEPLGDVSLSVTPLSGAKGRIPAEDVELLLVHYVHVDAPSDALGRSGEWPDALIPLRRPFALKAGRNQSVMLKVFLRPQLQPGVYRGKLTVAVAGVAHRVIDISVEVWDVTLPARVSLPFMVGVDYESIRKFEGELPDPEFEKKVLPGYYSVLRRNRAYPLFLHNGIPDVREEGGKLVVGFDSYQRRLEAATPDRNWSPIGIPYYDTWPIDTARHPLFSDSYRRLALSYLRQMVRFYERLGVLDRTFLYIPGTDEPIQKNQFDQVRGYAKLLGSADPRLRMLVTVFMECLDCRGEGIENLEDRAVLWVPNLAFFEGRALRARQKLGGLLGLEISSVPSGWTTDFTRRVHQRGGEIWWYLNPWTSSLPGAQQPPYANIYIDHQGIEHRALGWMAFRYGSAAIAHWNSTFWQKTPDPWTRLPRGEENPENPKIAGDGSLLYPARGSSRHTGQPDPDVPVSSLRLEMLREGSEDYELLDQLRQRGQDALATRIASGLVRSLQQFERDPAEYRSARRKLATAAQDQPPLSTTPVR